MTAQWVEPDVRDEIVDFIFTTKNKTDITKTVLLKMINLSSSKYYTWSSRHGLPNNHNGMIPKSNWLLDWGKEAIVKFKNFYLGDSGLQKIFEKLIKVNKLKDEHEIIKILNSIKIDLTPRKKNLLQKNRREV